MNITLIQPFGNEFDIEPPKGLASIAAVLDRARHQIRLIDLQIPGVRTQWETLFASESVDLVGITAMTPDVKNAHDIAERIKSLLPGLPVILGGTHATYLPEQTLYEFQAFDMLVLGEGEKTIVELVSRLERKEPIADVRGIAYRSNGKVIITPSRPRILDLDVLPDHHNHYDFDYYLNNGTVEIHSSKNAFLRGRSASLIVSRGCPFTCRFCATNKMWTRKYVCKSTDGVINEIRSVMKRGAERMKFRDSTFIINKAWVHEFCDKILKEKMRFGWAVNGRVDLVDFELFHHMKKAGLDTIYFGVESGSQKILDFYGKGITLEKTAKAFEICRKLEINTGAYFMLGALPETREDMELTYQFAKKIKPTFSYVYIFNPLPGSELYDYYINQGYQFDYNTLGFDKAVFPSAGLTREELEALREKWLHDFNPAPNQIVRAINLAKGVRSWHDVKYVWGKAVKRLPWYKIRHS
jgi:anaerobic magnesium-protoporphyrin IX monomethyl ester cyclase